MKGNLLMFLVQSSDKMFLCQSEVQKMTTTNGLERVCGVIMHVLTSSAVDHVFEIESNETQ